MGSIYRISKDYLLLCIKNIFWTSKSQSRKRMTFWFCEDPSLLLVLRIFVSIVLIARRCEYVRIRNNQHILENRCGFAKCADCFWFWRIHIFTLATTVDDVSHHLSVHINKTMTFLCSGSKELSVHCISCKWRYLTPLKTVAILPFMTGHIVCLALQVTGRLYRTHTEQTFQHWMKTRGIRTIFEYFFVPDNLCLFW